MQIRNEETQHSIKRRSYSLNYSLIWLRISEKLVLCYYGPFKIIRKSGKEAYKLALPKNSGIHLVFHVSQLKKVAGPNLATEVAPPASTHQELLLHTQDILQLHQLHSNHLKVHL